MTREEIKKWWNDLFGAKYKNSATYRAVEAKLEQICNAHEAKIKTKDERIEAQSSVIIACQNTILQKDEHIIELETERDKYNIIAANLQSSRGKVLMYLEDLETRISDFKMWLQDKVDDGAENYDKDEAFKEALEQLNKTLGGEDARNLDN